MIDHDYRAFLDALAEGDQVLVETREAVYLGAVVGRTLSGRIRVTWPRGAGVFYTTDVVIAGERVGAVAGSVEWAKLAPASLRLHTVDVADDVDALLDTLPNPATLAHRLLVLSRKDPVAAARIAVLLAELRQALEPVTRR